MSLVDVILPNTAAQAAHSDTNAGKGAENSSSQAGKAFTQSLPSQSAAIVSISSNSKNRTTSSRPQEKVDPGFGSEESRKRASQKEQNESGRKINITA